MIFYAFLALGTALGVFVLGYSLALLWMGKQLIVGWEQRKSRAIWRRNVVFALVLIAYMLIAVYFEVFV